MLCPHYFPKPSDRPRGSLARLRACRLFERSCAAASPRGTLFCSADQVSLCHTTLTLCCRCRAITNPFGTHAMGSTTSLVENESEPAEVVQRVERKYVHTCIPEWSTGRRDCAASSRAWTAANLPPVQSRKSAVVVIRGSGVSASRENRTGVRRRRRRTRRDFSSRICGSPS